MKRKLLLTLLCLSLCLCSISFIACAPHTHAYDSYGSDENGHWAVCSCGSKLELEEHCYTDGEITVSPTSTTDGEFTFECETCNHQKKETLKNTHDFINNFKDSVTAFSENNGLVLTLENTEALTNVPIEYYYYGDETSEILVDLSLSAMGEIFVGSDADNGIFVNGSVKVNVDAMHLSQLFANFDIEATIATEGQNVFVEATYSFEYPGLDSATRVLNDKEDTLRIATTLEEIFVAIVEESGYEAEITDFIANELPLIETLFNQEAMPILSAFWQEYGSDLADSLYTGITDILEFGKIGDDYVYSVDTDLIKQINTALSSVTFEEFYKSIQPDGDLYDIVDAVDFALDLKVSTILGFVFTNDFTIEDLESEINSILAMVYEGESVVPTISDLIGMDIVDMLTDPELLDMSIMDLISVYIAEYEDVQIEKADILGYIALIIDSVKDFTVYDLLLSSVVPSDTPNLSALSGTIATLINNVIDMLSDVFDCQLIIDKNGAFKEFYFGEQITLEKILEFASSCGFFIPTSEIPISSFMTKVSLVFGEFENKLNVNYTDFIASFTPAN